MSLHTKKSSLEQTSSLHNQIHDINSKYLKKKMQKNPKFPQEQLINGSIETHSPAIYLNGSTRHFEHEYLIKLSKKRSCPPSVESNAEFRSQQVSLIQKNSEPKQTQTGFSTGFPIHYVSLLNPDRKYIHIMVFNSQ